MQFSLFLQSPFFGTHLGAPLLSEFSVQSQRVLPAEIKTEMSCNKTSINDLLRSYNSFGGNEWIY